MENTLKSTAIDNPELINSFHVALDAQRNRLEHEDWQREQEAFKNPEMGELKIYGRMSP